MADKIVEYMEMHNTSFVRGATPKSIEKLANGKLKIAYEVDGKILEVTRELEVNHFVG
jgi:hypothetical protein